MTKPGRLIDQLRTLGRTLDTATDREAMRFLIRARKALREAIEEARPHEAHPTNEATDREKREPITARAMTLPFRPKEPVK